MVLDVGETLVDETSAWGSWADWFGVPRLTFFAVLGQVVARGEHHRRVFDVLVPGVDLVAEEAAREAAGAGHRTTAADLYPDALPCLRALAADGLRVGIAGNQPAGAEDALRAAGVEADFVASSARWGVEKPSGEFMDRVLQHAGYPAEQVAYVGDRVDNDVVPAARAGMLPVLVRRGPWARAQERDHPGAALAVAVVDGLDDLPGLLRRLGGTGDVPDRGARTTVATGSEG